MTAISLVKTLGFLKQAGGTLLVTVTSVECQAKLGNSWHSALSGIPCKSLNLWVVPTLAQMSVLFTRLRRDARKYPDCDSGDQGLCRNVVTSHLRI